ncbi:biotin--[acetyl-CoA-carboxylase] ligase [Bacteroidia bacterium]|nr:biotin--[acetyl-CoA-carboxylase] ligase [Bacteroidia bacterium]
MANIPYKLFSFDKIPSTQDYAHALVVDGRAKDRMIVLAEAQSMGRGRHRRAWVSHHGNLYVSFIFANAAMGSALSYAVAVSVAHTLQSFGIRARIKWPNDILVDSKKISGILIEYSGDFAIVGIGLNIKTNPTVSAAYKTTKTDNYVLGISRDALLAELKSQLDHWTSAKFRTVRAAWTALAEQIGEHITHNGQTGIMRGLDENGALILEVDGKEIKLKA